MEENKQQLTLFKVRDLRKKNQFKIDDAYLNGYARVCKPVATAVYNSLCRHAEFHSQKAFPSQGLIAYQHDISSKTVSRAIKKLAEYNIILIERDRWQGKFDRYVYTLLDKSEWKQISNQRTKTTYGQPADKNTSRQKTIVVKRPTKDNKEFKDNKVIYKDNKESETLSPSEEVKLFLEDEKYFAKIVDFISEKTNLSAVVILQELRKFRSYWSELNGAGTKQRWQLEKTFELKRRLSTWFRNAEKFNQSKPRGKEIIT